MPESEPLVQFPMLSPTVVALLLAFLVGLIVLAISIEIYRRVASRRKRIGAEWNSVHEILTERKLSESDQALLEQMVRRFSPKTPLRAVTTRHEFDTCVAQAMQESLEQGDEKEMESLGGRLRDIRCELSLDYVPLGQKISSTRELHGGQWLSIAPAADASPKWARMIVERVDEAYLYVAPRTQPGQAAPRIAAGTDVKVRLWRDEDARYLFTTVLAGVEDGPAIWRLLHTNELGRMQARNHYRVRYDQNTTVSLLNGSVDGDDSDVSKRRAVAKIRGRITSLSAGGCAVVVQQEISKQVMLRLNLELSPEKSLDLEAKIIASSSISGGRYLLRAAFVGLDDERRDAVAKYVLQRQQHKIAAREAAR